MNKKELLKLFEEMEKEDPVSDRHDRVLLIDGLNLFFRNFTTIKYVNEAGAHVGGLGGFIRSLNFLIKQVQPTSVYVVFDGVGSSTNRKNLLPEYKSGRNLTRITNWDMFESLEDENDSKVDQLVRLIHYLKCLPVKTVSIDKAEADDIIAYLSKKLPEKNNSQVFIVSNDRDFMQLVSKDVILFRPADKEFYDKNTVKQKFGILVENFILYKTLLGDNSDKVEGVKGLGEKGLKKKFPELAEKPMTFDELIDMCAEKHKENITYSRVVFDAEKLKRNYKIMDLSNPIISHNDELFLDEFIDEKIPKLNLRVFMNLYNEDGLGKTILRTEEVINDVYKVLNSFSK